MRHARFGIILLAFLVIAVGCAPRPFVPPVECEGQSSLILKEIPDPAALDKGLLAINLGAMKTVKGYDQKDAVAVLDQIEAMLVQADMTYADLTGYILAKLDVANALAGGLIFIIGDDIGRLNQTIPISGCDIELVRRHLERQRVLVAIYGAG
jgi:hypothetical protein